jgi:hypothetical protein
VASPASWPAARSTAASRACRSSRWLSLASQSDRTRARGLGRVISSLSLAQPPSKPGTATVQNHRFQWLQLPPASSHQDSGPKISLRRAGALAEPGSPSPPPVAGVIGRAGRAEDRWRGHAAPPASSAHPAPARQPPGAGTETKAPASLAHHRPQANHSRGRAGPAAPPRSTPAPGGTPGYRPCSLQHRGGPGPTADPRVAGQPDQLQQPPQRSGDVQLASDPSATCAAARATGTPAARAG